MEPRTKSVQLRVPVRLLNEVDRLAEGEDRTRSEATVSALRTWCAAAQKRRVGAGLAKTMDDGADRAAWEG